MGSDVGAELIPVCGGFQLSEFYCQHLDLKNRDPRDRGLSSIDLKKLHTVRPYWRAHRGQDHSIRVGANAFKALWHNRDKLPAVLRQYKQLYCDGDVLVNEFGVAHVFYLRWTKQDWVKENSPMDWRWGICASAYDWGNDYLALVL